MNETLKKLIGENCHWHYHLIKDIDPVIENNMDLLPEGSEKFAPKRKYEFIAGRICANTSLDKLGIKNFRVNSGLNREPLWPKGVVGSISHTKNFAISVVSKHYKALGIDAEKIMTKERYQSLNKQFLDDSERELIANDSKLGTLIFSAKESLYKALFPHIGTFFGFHDARVQEINQESLMIKLLRSDGKFSFYSEPISVEYLIEQELIITLIKIP